MGSKNKKNMIISDKRGLTLMETVIYVSLIGSVFGTFITFSIMASNLRSKMHAISEVRENSRTAGEVVRYFIRNSEETIEPEKQSTSTTLRLKEAVGGDEVRIYAEQGRIYVDDGATSTPITTNDVFVSDLFFHNYAATGTRDMIGINGRISSVVTSSPEFFYEDMIEYKISVPIWKL